MTKKEIIRLNIIRKISRNICIQAKIVSIHTSYNKITFNKKINVKLFSFLRVLQFQSDATRGIYHIYCRIIDSLKRT